MLDFPNTNSSTFETNIFNNNNYNINNNYEDLPSYDLNIDNNIEKSFDEFFSNFDFKCYIPDYNNYFLNNIPQTNNFEKEFNLFQDFKPSKSEKEEEDNEYNEDNNENNKLKKEIPKKRKRVKNEKKNKDKNNSKRKENKNIFSSEDYFCKIGNKINKKSYREPNMINMTIRNLIQDIFPNWINSTEKNKEFKIIKLNPGIFNNFDKFKDVKLKDIYSQEITVREKDKEHNIKVIKEAKGIKKDKLNFTFKEALILFFNESSNQIIFKVIKKVNAKEINVKEFLSGLKGKKEFLAKKGGGKDFTKKLKDILDKIEKTYLDDIYKSLKP